MSLKKFKIKIRNFFKHIAAKIFNIGLSNVTIPSPILSGWSDGSFKPVKNLLSLPSAFFWLLLGRQTEKKLPHTFADSGL
jgi:hypothetical protein